MADDPKVEEGKDQPAGEAGAGDGGEQAKHVPLHVVQKERERRQALEKELATLRAEIKKRDDEKLSDQEKLAGKLKELEPLAAQAEEAKKWASERLDRLLKGLPKETRDRLTPIVEGLPPHKAIEWIEATALSQEQAPRSAEVARGAPRQPTKTPSVNDVIANPALAGQLTGEQAEALLKELGLETGTGKVFG